MTAKPETPRARARAAVVEEIKAAARAQLAERGAAALSVRHVARDLGMSSSGMYRYFASRDDLLTALIIDAYDALGEAVERADAAVDRADLFGRWWAAASAVRTWARARPQEYGLVYGSPVPGYTAPQETVGPASRVPLALAAILRDAWVASRAASERRGVAISKAIEPLRAGPRRSRTAGRAALSALPRRRRRQRGHRLGRAVRARWLRRSPAYTSWRTGRRHGRHVRPARLVDRAAGATHRRIETAARPRQPRRAAMAVDLVRREPGGSLGLSDLRALSWEGRAAPSVSRRRRASSHHLANGGRRERLAPKEALREVAAHRDDLRAQHVAAHALGDDAQAHRVAHVEDRPHDRRSSPPGASSRSMKERSIFTVATGQRVEVGE